jgi:hypothetical protein
MQAYQEKSAIFRENVIILPYIGLTKHTTYEVKRSRIKRRNKIRTSLSSAYGTC